MGYAIAEKLADEGAKVILVSGPVSISVQNPGIEVISVESAGEMYEACTRHFPKCNGAFMTAAVADFTPVNPFSEKNKRGKENWNIEMKPTRDIAAALGSMKKENQLLVGFALETHNENANAQRKLKNKNLDFIVLNSLKDEGAGFGGDTNKITIIDKNNNQQAFELKSKKEVAADIVEKMVSLLD
jgi:phosphopantothenoylcysteine decarboxylase/phosphopantothenate--cysteine ligase